MTTPQKVFLTTTIVACALGFPASRVVAPNITPPLKSALGKPAVGGYAPLSIVLSSLRYLNLPSGSGELSQAPNLHSTFYVYPFANPNTRPVNVSVVIHGGTLLNAPPRNATLHAKTSSTTLRITALDPKAALFPLVVEVPAGGPPPSVVSATTPSFARTAGLPYPTPATPGE